VQVEGNGMTEKSIASPQMPGSFPDTRTLGFRLAAHVFLANDPSVPMVAADWWEISGPHYNAVAAALAHFVTGSPAAEDLGRFAASPGDRELEAALLNALLPLLDRSPADRARLGELVATAGLEAAWRPGTRHDRLSLFFDGGHLELGPLDSGTVRGIVDGIAVEEFLPPRKNPHLPLMADFARSVRNGTDPVCTIREADTVDRLIATAYAIATPLEEHP